MAVYIVTYDLHQIGQNYACLENALKGYPGWAHIQGSVWLVACENSAVQVRDNLSTCLDNNDSLFVCRLAGDAAWCGLSDQQGEWIKLHLR